MGTGSRTQHSSSSRTNPSDGWERQALNSLTSIIRDGNPEALVRTANEIGNNISQISPSQIRNIFGPVKQMSLEWSDSATPETAKRVHRQVILLRPKLSYLAARAKSGRPQMEAFERILSSAIEQIGNQLDQQTRNRFVNFVDFLEAIVAYHYKYADDKKKAGRE